MRIIEDFQYKYIEKCLYNFENIQNSSLETERIMEEAINQALEFFKDNAHEIMIREFYFKAEKQKSKLGPKYHRTVCEEKIHTDVMNGYVIRREIVYRIAMNCFALGLFQI